MYHSAAAAAAAVGMANNDSLGEPDHGYQNKLGFRSDGLNLFRVALAERLAGVQ